MCASTSLRRYDPNGNVRTQWERYDLKSDPLERENLARPGFKRTAEHQRQFERLKRTLSRVQPERLRPYT